MKPRSARFAFHLIIALSFTALSRAAEITKANNNDSLIGGSSWVGGLAPTAADIALFDATYAQAAGTTIGTGGPLSWGGIKVTTFTSGANPININNTITANHVGIGADGIDMSAAQRNLRVHSAQVQADQTWSIAAGYTLEIGTDLNGALAGGYEVGLSGSGTLRLINGGSLSLDTTSASLIGAIETYASTVTVAQDLSVAGKFSIGETGTAVFNQNGGTVNATSATAGFGAGLNIGHKIGGNGTYNLTAGTLNTSAAASIGVGGGNTGTLSISGGTANLAGLTLKTSDSASATANLTGGRLNLGSGGVNSLASATNRNLNLGGGTLGATADWSSSLDFSLTGTNGSTTIDTLDAIDNTTARTVTLSGNGSGAGGLVKTGTGTLVLDGALTYLGDTVVNDGILQLGSAASIRLVATGNGISNRISGNGTVILSGTLVVDLTVADIAVGNSWTLVDAPNTTYDSNAPGFSVESTTGMFVPQGDGTHVFTDTDVNTWTFDQATGLLTVVPSDLLVWNNASGDGLWNTTSANWDDGTSDVAFATGDSVRFSDTLAVLETVVVDGTVEPLITTLDHFVTDYQFTGSGAIGGNGPIQVNGGGFVGFSNTGGITTIGELNVTDQSWVLLETQASPAATAIGAGSLLELADGASLSGPVANDGTLLDTSTTGTITLTGVISGSGDLTKDDSSTLVLNAVNTFTGDVTVNAGVLRLAPGSGKLYQTGGFFGGANVTNIAINSGSVFETWNWSYGDANALSQLRNNYGQILLNGGTIRFTESFSSVRAFTIGAGGGTLEVPAGVIYNKPPGTTGSENIIRFSADSTLTLAGEGDIVIEDNLGTYGATGFGLAKTGSGTLTLTGANNYTGTTTVNGGTLAVNGTALPDASSLIIAGGMVAPTGTETVATLFFGATQQAAGTWGATGSGATHIDNTRFSGTIGVINVVSGPAVSGYASWAAVNGVEGQSSSDDHDQDGVPNGIEYFLGGPNGNTTGFTVLPAVTGNTGTWSITWTMGSGYAGTYGTEFVVETSGDLASPWTPATDGVDVVIDGSDVTYTFPTGPIRSFVRLKVMPP